MPGTFGYDSHDVLESSVTHCQNIDKKYGKKKCGLFPLQQMEKSKPFSNMLLLQTKYSVGGRAGYNEKGHTMSS